mmetsp:Transcript_119757/g.194836  ORF Transcript_119757/g.194836 Transcript_119757/m.194836 type:complete len:125 (-) Transcript_119757:153-527(-)
MFCVIQMLLLVIASAWCAEPVAEDADGDADLSLEPAIFLRQQQSRSSVNLPRIVRPQETRETRDVAREKKTLAAAIVPVNSDFGSPEMPRVSVKQQIMGTATGADRRIQTGEQYQRHQCPKDEG